MRKCRCTRIAARARWLQAAANASAASTGASTPPTCRPIFARVTARAAAISGVRPAMRSGTAGSWRKAPRGPLPSGGSHQPYRTSVSPAAAAAAGRGPAGCPTTWVCRPDPTVAAADSSMVFSAARDLR